MICEVLYLTRDRTAKLIWIIAVLCCLVMNVWLAGIATLLLIGGMLISRWLFFAEAEHVVGLYYGR